MTETTWHQAKSQRMQDEYEARLLEAGSRAEQEVHKLTQQSTLHASQLASSLKQVSKMDL